MRALALGAAACAAASACFDDVTPPRGEQIGGTQYNINLSVPSPIRVPASSGVNTYSRVVTGTLIVDSVRLTLSGLKRLAPSAGYQFFVVNGQTGAAWPIRHTARITRTDTSFSSGVVTTSTVTTTRASARAFEGAPFNTTVQFVIRNGAAPDTIGLGGAWLVLTIQADTNAPAFGPTTPKMFWLQFRNQGATTAPTDDTPIAVPVGRFGTFRPERPDSSRLWTPQGTGRGAFWDRERDTVLHFAGLAFGLPQPPIGYYYQPYARDAATGAAAPFGMLRGQVTDASLIDADLAPAQGTLAQLPTARFEMIDTGLTCSHGTCPSTPRIHDFTAIQLVLEPKLGDPTFPNQTVALQGIIGSLLTSRRARAGVVVATVMQGTTPVQNASIAVYGTGTTTLIASGATGADGRAVITGVASRPVDVRAFVATGTVTPASQTVEVPPGDTARVTFMVQ